MSKKYSLSEWFGTNGALLAVAVMTTFSAAAAEQTLYKHVDKNGKVTYSDKVPKEGEQASKVVVDPTANIVKMQTKDSSGKEQKFADIKARGDARAALREKLQKDVTTSEEALEKAKKALESGRDPVGGETRIVVRKGGNSVIRLPEYYNRIAGLEKAIKKAEVALKDSEEKYRRGSPD